MAGSCTTKKKVIVVPKIARIINSDTENIYVSMNAIQWIRETHDGEEGNQLAVSIFFAGSTEETALKLQGVPARKFMKYLDLGG
jgi:hypothetical protein